jgi:hypothetical protein
VDNTTDASKPISTATQTALNAKADLVAGKVPESQLPAYVDEIQEYANFAALPGTGTAGIIYVTLNDDKTHRWSGTQYVEISPSLVLGETSTTASAGACGRRPLPGRLVVVASGSDPGGSRSGPRGRSCHLRRWNWGRHAMAVASSSTISSGKARRVTPSSVPGQRHRPRSCARP